ncbi:uncharacterized protein CMC5_032770 [Chondromyces crocatus]|uniref:Uncharacterized protein n=1 Tax=Chondromyces crocatus TaxID=52 RepID=A0A0K1EE38_CHOCO|nr:uncharacterized protein CMC5_032770 [Chondromyces crocatus]
METHARGEVYDGRWDLRVRVPMPYQRMEARYR